MDEIKQFKSKSVARFLTRQEILKFYKVCPKKLRKTIIIFLYSGLRLSEYLKATRIDKGIHIEKSKTGFARIVPVHIKIKRILPKMLGVWSKDGLESALRTAVKRAKIGRVRTHDFRHTFASFYLQSGGTLADLRLILGQRDLKSLQIYAHFQPMYLEERMNATKIWANIGQSKFDKPIDANKSSISTIIIPSTESIKI